MEKKVYIYESPDKGKTIFRRKFGETERERLVTQVVDESKRGILLVVDLGIQTEQAWIPESECTWASKK